MKEDRYIDVEANKENLLSFADPPHLWQPSN